MTQLGGITTARRQLGEITSYCKTSKTLRDSWPRAPMCEIGDFRKEKEKRLREMEETALLVLEGIRGGTLLVLEG